MNRSTSEKILMQFGPLDREVKKSRKPDPITEKPEPPKGGPMGPGGMPPMGPPPEIRTLVLLKTVEKEMKRPEIGMILGLPPMVNNKTLDKLAELGLITLRQDPEDERKSYASISEAGIAKLEKDKEERKQHAADFLKALTAEEQETLLSLLEKIHA